MNRDPFKKDEQLKQLLDSYHVNVPEFPIESPGRWQRMIHWLATPSKNPIEPLIESYRSYSIAGTLPLLLAFVLAVLN